MAPDCGFCRPNTWKEKQDQFLYELSDSMHVQTRHSAQDQNSNCLLTHVTIIYASTDNAKYFRVTYI